MEPPDLPRLEELDDCQHAPVLVATLPDTELHQDAVHVLLDGVARNDQSFGDAAVRPALRHEGEHLALALGQHGERITPAPGPDQLLHESRIDHRSTTPDPVDGLDELVHGQDATLEQVPDPLAGAEQLHGQVDFDVGGEQQDPGGRKLLPDDAGRLDPLGLMVRGHADVDDDEVRLVFPHEREQPFGVACLSDDDEAVALQQACDAFAQQHVIVGKYDPSRPRRQSRSIPREHANPLVPRAGEGVVTRAEMTPTSSAMHAQCADEMKSLHRVATLVAQAAAPEEVFTAVAAEAARLREADMAGMSRFDADGAATLLGFWSRTGETVVPVGTRLEHGGNDLHTLVFRTGRPARIDDYGDDPGHGAHSALRRRVRSVVGAPIFIAGQLWGQIALASTRRNPLPPETEAWLAGFTDLVAAAIANAQSREAIARLADEQAALRRVATLVAQGVPRAELFYAVTVEVAQLVGADHAHISRFDDDRAFILMGMTTEAPGIRVGSRFEFEGWMTNAEVCRTGRAARSDEVDWSTVEGAYGAAGGRLGVVSLVSAPIVVDGHLWGEITVTARKRLPPDTDERVENFSDLVATAIANAEGKSELEASRRRIVTASDEARRRIERDLHDGTQQRLVSLSLAVRSMEATLPSDRLDFRDELSRIATGLSDAVAELQEISRGIHPAVLARGGLGLALRSMGRRSAIPVELDIRQSARLPETIEVAAYYAASEALANATKHSKASHVKISLAVSDGLLQLVIDDDGVGGADAMRGSGLVGLGDRVEALRGSIRIRSRPGEGTQIAVELPVDIDSPQEHVETVVGRG